MDELSGVLFEDRFLERYAGAITTDPVVAIVELVANTWDAWPPDMPEDCWTASWRYERARCARHDRFEAPIAQIRKPIFD